MAVISTGDDVIPFEAFHTATLSETLFALVVSTSLSVPYLGLEEVSAQIVVAPPRLEDSLTKDKPLIV